MSAGGISAQCPFDHVHEFKGLKLDQRVYRHNEAPLSIGTRLSILYNVSRVQNMNVQASSPNLKFVSKLCHPARAHRSPLF